MGRRSHSPIASAGLPFLIAAALLALLAAQFHLLYAIPFLAAFFFLLYLFRDPWRTIPADPLGIVAPIDGHVVEIVNTNNPLTAHQDKRITIQFNWLGAYTVHSATEGKISNLRQNGPDTERRGKNRRALCVYVVTDEKDDVIMVVHRGLLANFPRIYHRAGERVGQGRRLSYVPFGKRIDLYVPMTAKVNVSKGDKLVAAETILAHFVH